MSNWIVFLFTMIIILLCIALNSMYNRYKELKLKLKWWPVLHRLDDQNRLQYSVDGKLWTYVMGFVEEFDYGTYKGPGFTYIVLEDEELDEWSNMLYTLQKCHEWNRSALNHYREAIDKYLETNKK